MKEVPEWREFNMSGFVERLNAKMRVHMAEAKELAEKNGEPRPFVMEPHEWDRYLKWEREHSCALTTPTPENPFPGGAIGGATSVTFTPTGIGIAVTVSCECGAEENITDYEVW